MKRLSLIIIFSFIILYLPYTLLAQKNYKKGYIITNENDTIHGLIHLTSKLDFGKKCEFLRKNISESEIFTPNQIKKIKTEDKYYVSKEIILDNEKKVIFLEVLFEGFVNAYYLDDQNFFIEKEDSLYQLSIIEKEIIREEDGKKYYMESKEYLGIIAFLFKDEPTLIQEFGNNRLTSKVLIKTFKEYCEKVCKGCNFIDYTQNKKHSVFIEPQIGFSYAILRFPTSNDYDSYLAPIGGINIHIPSVKNHRWDYIVGINYSNQKFQGDYTHSIYNKEETYRVGLKYSTLTIPLKIEYTFTDKKLQPTFKLGFNNIFILNQDNSLENILKTDLGDEIASIIKTSTMRSFQYGFMSGCGIKYKINGKSFLQLNCNFEFCVSSINTHYFLDKQKISSIQINLGYSFKVK